MCDDDDHNYTPFQTHINRNNPRCAVNNQRTRCVRASHVYEYIYMWSTPFPMDIPRVLSGGDRTTRDIEVCHEY